MLKSKIFSSYTLYFMYISYLNPKNDSQILLLKNKIN